MTLATGILMVLMSSSVPADYSSELLNGLWIARDAGLTAEVDLNGMDTRTQAWLKGVVSHALKKYKRDHNETTPKTVSINIDSGPFQALKVKRVPVFIYSVNGRLYEVDGAYDVRRVLARIYEESKDEALKSVLKKMGQEGK